MKFQVQMLAFGKPGEIRQVEVSDDELQGLSVEQQLDIIFREGQNDFQPKEHPSIMGLFRL